MKIRQKLGALLALGVLTGTALIAAPAIAQAHTGDLKVTAVCNTETGQYDLTATLTTKDTGLAGQTFWRIGTETFEGTPKNPGGMSNGPIASLGAQAIPLSTWSLPGTTIGFGPWVYAFTTWSDQYTHGSDGQLTKRLSGDCKKPEPPFEGVEKYTPTVNVTCDAATFSHPAIKTGLGIANVYGIRYGATQAEAQAKAFEPYTPGTVITLSFENPTIANTAYFELKVGYDGKTLTHQIGQTRANSEACIPKQPEAVKGAENRAGEPLCIVPPNGTATVTTEAREWTHGWVWSAEARNWVPDEKVYGEWKPIKTSILALDTCLPEAPQTPMLLSAPTPPQKIQTAARG